MRIGRLLIAGLAVVACAWFALGVRQAQSLDQATAIVKESPPPTGRQLAHASSLLSTAGTLNPDAEVQLVRGRVAMLENHHVRAEHIVEQVVRDEPRNLEAWFELAQVAGADQKTLFRALGQVNKLDPSPRNP